jgi:hypothetical protein
LCVTFILLGSDIFLNPILDKSDFI